MEPLPLSHAFTLIEPGPVVLLTTNDGQADNVMTITWTMVLGFSGRFALCTGPWNHSYAALETQRDCVLAIPTADMLDTVVGVGTCSGADTDKFARFGLARAPASVVKAPLLPECLANIECRVTEVIEAENILILQARAAWIDRQRAERRMLHANGDGTFVADGERFDRREAMRAKLPPGLSGKSWTA